MKVVKNMKGMWRKKEDDHVILLKYIKTVGKDMYVGDKNWVEAYHIAMGRLELSNRIRVLKLVQTDPTLYCTLDLQESVIRFQMIQYIIQKGCKTVNEQHSQFIHPLKNSKQLTASSSISPPAYSENDTYIGTIKGVSDKIEQHKQKNIMNGTIKAHTTKTKNATVKQKSALQISNALVLSQIVTIDADGILIGDSSHMKLKRSHSI